MKPWALIDISYLAHRARYSMSGMEYEDFNTGILYGFWEQLRVICDNERIKSNRVALFFDSRHSYRKKIFPEYKANRRKSMDVEEANELRLMAGQVKLLRKDILPAIGFPVFYQNGCESDDLMAQAAIQIQNNNQEGIIVTADGDLYQCITDSIFWFDPNRHKFHTMETFFQEKDIASIYWGKVKQIAGCPGDDVPGVPRVGEKTAIRFLNKQLPTHHQTFKNIMSPEGQEIIKRNESLVILPHRKTKPIDINPPEYHPEAFFAMCERYGFVSYLKEPKRTQWEQFFQNKFHGVPLRKRNNATR